MSFLAPLFLLGGLAVALPIVLHLIRRSSRERMTFSSLMFLRPTPPRVTRRNRLEHVFLLLLRCLVICLLALGFSRPFFQKPVVANPEAVGGRKAVVLLDTSASMRRDGLWPAAIERAGAVLRGASPADQVAVFAFDRQTRQLVSFREWSAMAIGERAALTAQRVAEARPGWASTHLGNAIIAAAEAFAEVDSPDQKPGPKRIVLITDLQEGSRLDSLQGYEWPRGIEVVVEPVKAKRPTNASLQWVLDTEESAHADSNAVTRVRVNNSGDAAREQFQVQWEDVSGAAPMDAYVPPGQSRVVQAPRLPDGRVGERLVLAGDDNDFDNRFYLIQPNAERLNVLFLGDDPETDPARLLFYVQRAFQETRRRIVQVTSRPSTATLSPADFANVSLAIATDGLSGNRLESARDFLAGGGTMLFVMKSAGAAATVSQLAGTDNLSVSESPASGYAMFGQIDFEHPLFSPFADPRYSDFTRIHIWKYRRLDAGQLPGARVLARFDSGDPALLELPQGKGRLFILTAGWHPADSQLALSSKFVPLLYSFLEQAGGIQGQRTQFSVGDEVPLPMAGGSPPPAVRKPDGTQTQLQPGEKVFTGTDEPGIYSVTSLQPPWRFAVNLDAAESRTAPMPVEELERLGVPLKPPEIDSRKLAEQKRLMQNAELESQQKLWRTLILAALVVLMVETWLAGWLMRRTAAQTAARA